MSIGSYATTYNNSVSIGYNSGVQSSASNQNNTYIGNNSNVPYSTNYSQSCAIGYNSVINSSNTIQLGRDLLDTTNCYALTTTNLTGTNITGTNITTTNLTSSTINTNLSILSYSTLPMFVTQKYVGYLQSTNSLKFYSSFNNFLNLCQISVSVGIWIVQYQISYNYSASNILAWHTFGVELSKYQLKLIFDINLQNY